VNSQLKNEVKDHWEAETAGVRYGDSDDTSAFYQEVRDRRYELEPYIPEFADFNRFSGKQILEIGVGGGVDFSNFVHAGANASGVDLTEAALGHARAQLSLVGADPDTYSLRQADAEHLPFADQGFDLVYSWGVLHHTPDTRAAFSEALRVLKPGGSLKAMVYHTRSWTGLMLWVIYGLMRGRPWKSPRKCIYEHLESPGTKAYGVAEFRRLLVDTGFTDVSLSTRLSPADLLTIRPSGRHRSLAARIAWKLYPRGIARLLGDRFGLFLLVDASRPTDA
jgi:ubiquinone/menaquinone biosynthesis C-methylase UbiE